VGTFPVELLRKRVNVFCCAERVPAAGLVASALQVRYLRSCRPFYCGLPGSSNSGHTPTRTHQAERFERRASLLVANGTPLSVQIRRGNPYSLKSLVKMGVAAWTAGKANLGSPGDSG
jgi:hypothetical protein